eukprot:985054-Rhodomonas_salina.1
MAVLLLFAIKTRCLWMPLPRLHVETPCIVKPLLASPAAVDDSQMSSLGVDHDWVSARLRRCVDGRAVRPAPCLEVEKLRLCQRCAPVSGPPSEHQQMLPACNGSVIGARRRHLLIRCRTAHPRTVPVRLRSTAFRPAAGRCAQCPDVSKAADGARDLAGCFASEQNERAVVGGDERRCTAHRRSAFCSGWRHVGCRGRCWLRSRHHIRSKLHRRGRVEPGRLHGARRGAPRLDDRTRCWRHGLEVKARWHSSSRSVRLEHQPEHARRRTGCNLWRETAWVHERCKRLDSIDEPGAGAREGNMIDDEEPRRAHTERRQQPHALSCKQVRSSLFSGSLSIAATAADNKHLSRAALDLLPLQHAR